MTKLHPLIADFEESLKRLEEVLKMDKTDVIRDSAIKRFEIVFELAWKTTKAFLEEYHNTACVSPRTCFKQAFNKEVIAYDDFWVDIISLRNYTAHTYKEKLAEMVYKSLPVALNHFRDLLQKIKTQMENA